MRKEDRPPEWPWQKDGRLFLKERLAQTEECAEAGAGLGYRPGRGKTRPTIRRIQAMHKSGTVNLALVVNVLSGMHVWVENWHDWADIPAIFIDLREHGSAGIRMAESLAKAGNLVICLCGYEGAWQIGHRRVKEPTKGGQERSVLKAVDTTLYDVEWDLAVLDEIHKISAPDSKVARFFVDKMRPVCRHRIGLTGSLITKNPGKAYMPVKFLTGEEIFPGPYGGRQGVDNYGHRRPASFLSRYAIMDPYIPGKIDLWHNLDDFARRLARVFYIPDEDAMPQKEAIHVYRRVPLSKESRRVYDRLTKDLYVELEAFEKEGRDEYKALVDYLSGFWKGRIVAKPSPDPKATLWTWPDEAVFRDDVERDARLFVAGMFEGGVSSVPKAEAIERLREHSTRFSTVTIEHVFSAMRKQQQIANGFVVPDAPEDDPGRKMEPVALGREKVDALIEDLEKFWVEPPGKPQPVVVVVFDNFSQNAVVEAIRKRFAFEPKVLDGGVTGAQRRHEMIAGAAKDPVFVMKAQVGAESIDCQWAEAFIFFSKDPHTVRYEQLLARMLRGKRESGLYIHLIADKTVDDRIEEILRGDLDLARRVERDWRSAIESR